MKILKFYEQYSYGNNLTFVKAAQVILKDNDNQPMSSIEIWNEIKKRKLVSTRGKTPVATLSSKLLYYSVDSPIKGSIGQNIFRIVSKSPYKYVLVNSDEIQDEEEEENDEVVKLPIAEFADKYVKNPLRQGLCIVGDSGAGKSYTIDNILKKEGHEFDFIIPTASTTGLLSQFSKKEYVLSRLGNLILEAKRNPNKYYTAVFDEMHKPNVIEMINDELLQCISTKRNKFSDDSNQDEGYRYISLDKKTAELYDELETLTGSRGNNKLLPDNFGFIFISSKPDVIVNNSDFFNRVDIVKLTERDRNMTTIKQLLDKEKSKENKDFVEKLKKES
jgi:hypothetical protein